MIESFRDLAVWQKSMTLATEIYASTAHIPRSELFGLTFQINKSAVSIPSNVAEGKATGGQSYNRHLKIALGSEAELQTQVELASRLKMLPDDEAKRLLQHTSEVGRMLVALLKSLPRD